MKNPIRVIRYRTINQCLAAFFCCKAKDLDGIDGDWETRDADGLTYSHPAQVAISNIRTRDSWGWISKRNTIHCFFRKKCGMDELVGLFAHELGHAERPFHRSVIEEQKASKYARVATGAYAIAEEILKGNRDFTIIEED